MNPKTNKPGGRGFCHGNPPTVILMPGDMPKIAMGHQGDRPLNFIPHMLRPVTSYNERFCGMYSPDAEAQAVIMTEGNKNEAMDQNTEG